MPNGSSAIRIAVIADKDMAAKVARCLGDFPSLDPIYRIYAKSAAAADLAKEAEAKADVILFGSVTAYQLAKQRYHFDIPMLFVPLTGSGLCRSLSRLECKHGFASLSIDTLSRPTIETALAEFGWRTEGWRIHEESFDSSEEELLAFHLEAHRADPSSRALTAAREVAVQLARTGVPCERIVPTDQDIIVTLERALLSTEWRRNNEAQTVMGLIHVDDFGKPADLSASGRAARRPTSDIHRALLGFAEQLDGHLAQLSADEYLFVTTRGVFERETGGYKRIPVARRAYKEFGARLSIGVGFGYSAGQAGIHARRSLRLAMDGGGSNCFIVREDDSVIGPLEMTEPMELDLSLVDAGLLKRVESVGLTAPYLGKLIAHATRFGRIEYFAQELASVFGITTRSVHRFLLAWTDAGLVEIVGEERGGARGRPRQRYRMCFLTRLLR